MAAEHSTDAMRAAVHASFARLREEVGDLWQPLSAVARVDASTLTALQFHREFVSRSVPVVLTNAMAGDAEWTRALEHWPSDAYLAEQAGDESVTVDVTPFGRGDAVLPLGDTAELFVMPEEREMTLREFLDVLGDREGFDGVPYLSHQVRRLLFVGFLWSELAMEDVESDSDGLLAYAERQSARPASDALPGRASVRGAREGGVRERT